MIKLKLAFCFVAICCTMPHILTAMSDPFPVTHVTAESKLKSMPTGILAVEAYHAGYVRTALIQNGDVMTPYGVNVTTIVNAISARRDMLDGTETNDDEGIYNTMFSDYMLVPKDGNAVAYSRTPAQVLEVVYLSAAGTPGGFFPNGVNGKIQ